MHGERASLARLLVLAREDEDESAAIWLAGCFGAALLQIYTWAVITCLVERGAVSQLDGHGAARLAMTLA